MTTASELVMPRPDHAAAMTASEAFDLVHELACLNALDSLETSGDAGLEAHGRWQREALDGLGLVLHQHAAIIDEQLPLPSPALCPPAADWLREPERDMDPQVPSNAARICFSLAGDAVLEAHECGAEEVLLAGRARQQCALGLVRAVLCLHADRLDDAVATAERGDMADGTASEAMRSPTGSRPGTST